MAIKRMRDLTPGYAAEVDTVGEQQWHAILEDFDDANIFQTWPYGAVTSGHHNLSHILLKLDGVTVAAAQARIARVPGLAVGIAYVRWGPLFRRRNSGEQPEIFRQAIRALRNEYACRRGFVIRIYPNLFDSESQSYAAILAEEKFASIGAKATGRTILMDLKPSLNELREGMNSHWKRELKIAERKSLAVTQGSGDDLFASMIDIHREMVSRKRFAEGSDINQFRLMQRQLPDSLKMKVLLCSSTTGPCAGVVCSAIGNTAVYLFGATGDRGMKSNGSYLLHWKVIEQFKQEGRTVYDLNGINAVKNPGTYKFKKDLAGTNGKDVSFLGQFESDDNVLSRFSIDCFERLGSARKWLKANLSMQRLDRA